VKRRDFVQGAVGSSLALIPLSEIGSARAQDPAASVRGAFADIMIPPTTRRHALVIGNATYTHVEALENPLNDARAMASALRELAFDVDYHEDAGLSELEDATERLTERVANEEVALVYYAGHGVQLDGINYLLPVDIQVRSSEQLIERALSFDRCIAATNAAGAGLGILILDACRDNPFDALRGALGRGLASVTDARGETFISYAAAAGAVAYDDAQNIGNSPFTAALVSALEVPGHDIYDVFRIVRGRVREATEGRQLPWLSSSLERSFIFRFPEEELERHSVVVTAPPAPESPAEEPAVDVLATPEEPATLAETVTAALATVGRPPPSSAAPFELDTLMWQAIRFSQTQQDFQTFLGLYPESEFAEDARAMLENIRYRGLPELPQPTLRRTIGTPLQATDCDLVAAAPHDANRIAEGVINGLVNTRLAIRACTEAVTADPSNPRLQFQLGRVLDLREQWDEAEHYYIKACEQRYPIAFSSRANLYQTGVPRPRDFDFAFELHDRAATLGDLSGELNVAKFYLEGWAVGQSVQAAIIFYERAAAKDFPAAWDSLGTLYSREQYGVADPVRAVGYYRRAAELGNNNAINSLARAYLAGNGIERDYDEAVALFEAAIERGNIFAPYHLARMYRDGWGIEQDLGKAAELYRMAGERGFSGGWLELGALYETGQGVPQDLGEAYFWLYVAREIALERSANDPVYKAARERADELASGLTLAERFAVERRAEQWLGLNGPAMRRARSAFQ
jgi:uncharacterized protein